MKHKVHRCAYEAPARVWERTENGWSSRAWQPAKNPGELSEKEQYEKEVLGR